MTYTCGSSYDGHWYNGKKSGEGKQTYANGDKYYGQWFDGNKSGKGILI